MPSKMRLSDGGPAFSMATVMDIKNLLMQDVRLQRRFAGSRADTLLKEIHRLEDEDKELENLVENLHKEVKQIADAASRLQDMADKEDMEARAKREKLKNCLEQLVKDHADILSDPDSFAEGYNKRLKEIGNIVDASKSPSGCLIDLEESAMPSIGTTNQTSPLSKLNRAHRRKLLVQVELDRIEEELKIEIERSAVSEPASHPVFGSDDDEDDVDLRVNDDGSLQSRVSDGEGASENDLLDDGGDSACRLGGEGPRG
ncbi:unnamed protein product [Ostreobium quekettii]|uniref:Uncharacterized protein n=1 Tax=Ostreobium quekettii TaxID=121088 RepID=A0A8S1ILR1_9CHLO|nr:unnamed protein product [Ostreobium quekettii]|eukprot:evm.model.scf_254EXC.10 EVM.evm.TU.scf_254EXC.10   scf_254EXC:79554-83596(+)